MLVVSAQWSNLDSSSSRKCKVADDLTRVNLLNVIGSITNDDRVLTLSDTRCYIDKFPLNFLGGNAGLLLFTELCICYNIFAGSLPAESSFPQFCSYCVHVQQNCRWYSERCFLECSNLFLSALCCAIQSPVNDYPLLVDFESPFLELQKDCKP